MLHEALLILGSGTTVHKNMAQLGILVSIFAKLSLAAFVTNPFGCCIQQSGMNSATNACVVN